MIHTLLGTYHARSTVILHLAVEASHCPPCLLSSMFQSGIQMTLNGSLFLNEKLFIPLALSNFSNLDENSPEEPV